MSEQSGSELMTIDQVVRVVGSRLADILDANTDEAGLVPTVIEESVAVVWNHIQMLQAAVAHNEQMLASALMTAEELKQQRDMATREAKFNKGKREQAVIYDLAKYLGYDAQIPPGDVARVIEMLVGIKDLPVSSYVLSDFYEALRELATEAFAEEIYQADAMAEYDAEIARDQEIAAEQAAEGKS